MWGGVGSAGSHWRESVFDTELMTSLAENTGTAMPISRITVGQFADLGYVVNYAAADAYTKPVAVPLVRPQDPSKPLLPPRSMLLANTAGNPQKTAIFAAFSVSNSLGLDSQSCAAKGNRAAAGRSVSRATVVGSILS